VLHYLQIENFVIVEQLKLQFNSGLTIISGETGAGKSIVIDALSLVLGERADSNLVRQGCETAQVSAVFSLPLAAQQWLEQQHLSQGYAEECFVRRVVNHNGRSRAYINDKPVSMQTVRQLGEYLVDIHGQHAHQSLLKPEIQRQLIDSIIDNQNVLQQVQNIYQQWNKLKTELESLGGEDHEAKITLLRYQVQEFENFEVTTEALENLEIEYRRLINAQKLLDTSQYALTLLDNDEAGATLSGLNQASNLLEEMQENDSQLTNIYGLLENAIIQTQEAVGELRSYIHNLDLDAERLQDVQQQINQLQDLARKHRIRYADLPIYVEQLNKELTELENYEERIANLEIKIAENLENYKQISQILHQQRAKTAEILSEQITKEIQNLGMPGGKLVINVNIDEQAPPSSTGSDKIAFLVSTNPGNSPKPLQQVASGGELSRISLAIQVITTESSGVPILVFDEVDVGIGGGVAEIVGQLLNKLGQQRQVLCITHLAQVASQGHHHLQVSKNVLQERTYANIKQLDYQQRIEEIARMLGGIEITSQTLAHAQEMLLHASQ
jgi:DNA repair protein RecN (Recombination protein N)